MDKNIQLELLKDQLVKYEYDKKELQDGILAMETKAKELAVQIQLNHGAISYNHVLSESTRKQIRELESQI